MKIPFVLFLVGPTGSGKSEIAIRIAKKVKGEIVSADSMLIYKGMNIGTAKPSREERGEIKHHMIDLVSPRTKYSVDQFRLLALKKIRGIIKRKRCPIVVGGSGMYIEALIDGLPPTESTKPQVRQRLEVEAAKDLNGAYERLSAIDPDRATQILPNDLRRIVRALEIYEVTGERPSDWMRRRVSLNDLGIQWKLIGLKRNREELYARINCRVDHMVQCGFLREVKRLKRNGLSLTAKQAIGYKEMIEHLNGVISLATAIETTKKRSRHLAKKQLIWFRREPRIHWYSVKKDNYNPVILKILKLYG